MGSFCIYKQLKRMSILCYGEFMESAILHNIRCLFFSVVYKCRRIPSYDLKYTDVTVKQGWPGVYSRIWVQQESFVVNADDQITPIHAYKNQRIKNARKNYSQMVNLIFEAKTCVSGSDNGVCSFEAIGVNSSKFVVRTLVNSVLTLLPRLPNPWYTSSVESRDN